MKKLDWSRTRRPGKQFLSRGVWKNVQADAKAAIAEHPLQEDQKEGLEPAIVQLRSCDFQARCGARDCKVVQATVIARKLDASGRFIRQVELCNRHAEVILNRERKRGLKIVDRRSPGRS